MKYEATAPFSFGTSCVPLDMQYMQNLHGDVQEYLQYNTIRYLYFYISKLNKAV